MAKEKTAFRTSIGGQALIEGLLMRGPKKQAIVCRKSDGELIVKEEELKLIKDRYPILGLPLIRGVVGFGDSIVKGMKALMWSADQMPEEEQEEPGKIDKWIEEKFGWEKAQKFILGIGVFLGIAFSVGLFFVLPALITSAINNIIDSRLIKTMIEGAVRIAIFLIYLWASTRMKEIRRVFEYHGAEHKTIHCYERGLPLTVENVREMPRQHPRCGTSFMFVVMLVSIVVLMFVSWSSIPMRILIKISLLPLIVAISYEFNRLVGRYDNPLTRFLSWPGRKLQHLTVFEPDDSMIEVAIEALGRVVPEEQGEDKW